jgi:hypothetical protein
MAYYWLLLFGCFHAMNETGWHTYCLNRGGTMLRWDDKTIYKIAFVLFVVRDKIPASSLCNQDSVQSTPISNHWKKKVEYPWFHKQWHSFCQQEKETEHRIDCFCWRSQLALLSSQINFLHKFMEAVFCLLGVWRLSSLPALCTGLGILDSFSSKLGMDFCGGDNYD